MKKYFFNLYSFISVLVIMTGMFVFSYIDLDLDIFNPLKISISDIDFTDLAYTIFKETENLPIEDKIIIINSGQSSRTDIANVLTSIQKHNPKVIGIDILFEENKTNLEDSVLEAALSKSKDVVLVYNIQDLFNNNLSFFAQHSLERFEKHTFTGFSNLPVDKTFRTIRKFFPFLIVNNDTFPSFDSKIVELYDTISFSVLKRRNKELEIINFLGNVEKFNFIDYKDVLENNYDPSIFNNKIVLIGFVGKSLFDSTTIEDKFFTPLNVAYTGRSIPDMFGIVIHANIITTIINKSYINKFEGIVLVVVLFFFLYINSIILNILLYRFSKYYSILNKILTLLLSISLLLSSVYFYNNLNFYFDIKLPILGIIFLPGVQSFINRKLPNLIRRKPIK